MISFEKALEIISNAAYPFDNEEISIENCLGRILASDFFTDRDYPPFNRASMDGFAIKFDDFQQAIRDYKIIETIYAGQKSKFELKSGECYKIMTGAAVPLFANMIIRVEDSQEIAPNFVKLASENPKINQNIAQKGEDKKAKTLILSKGTVINQAALATLAVVGKSKVWVYKSPTLAIVSTGNELRKVSETVNDVQIRESNSYLIRAAFENYKITPNLLLHSLDNEAELTQNLSQALKHNIVVISGGVSAGDADFVPQILQNLGVKMLFHKVQIKPGKPFWFGIGPLNTIVFALPGNPLSVQVATKIFIAHFLQKCLSIAKPLFIEVPILEDRIKKNTLDEFLPCVLEFGEKTGVISKKFNGSGDISATIETDGFYLHPKNKQILKSGDLVQFYKW